MSGYQVGDYVIVSHPNEDSESNGFGDPDETFVAVEITSNAFGRPLVRVRRIGANGYGTSFYPHELSWEDGSRPTV